MLFPFLFHFGTNGGTQITQDDGQLRGQQTLANMFDWWKSYPQRRTGGGLHKNCTVVAIGRHKMMTLALKQPRCKTTTTKKNALAFIFRLDITESHIPAVDAPPCQDETGRQELMHMERKQTIHMAVDPLAWWCSWGHRFPKLGHLWSLLLTWINFNPSMDMGLYPL